MPKKNRSPSSSSDEPVKKKPGRKRNVDKPTVSFNQYATANKNNMVVKGNEQAILDMMNKKKSEKMPKKKKKNFDEIQY